ncbi:MAG: hypothetical protein WCG99_03150 [Candidatus Berkelbacteria bacterium]
MKFFRFVEKENIIMFGLKFCLTGIKKTPNGNVWIVEAKHSDEEQLRKALGASDLYVTRVFLVCNNKLEAVDVADALKAQGLQTEWSWTPLHGLAYFLAVNSEMYISVDQIDMGNKGIAVII